LSLIEPKPIVGTLPAKEKPGKRRAILGREPPASRAAARPGSHVLPARDFGNSGESH